MAAAQARDTVPAAFRLHGARPNPFTGRTVVPFEVAEVSRVRLAVYDVLGREEPAAVTAGLPAEAVLHAAAPNPVAGLSTLRYDVAEAGAVRLAVYDLLGREVAVLVDGAHAAGRYAVTLDGRALPAGVYLVRMTAGGSTQAQRVSVIR